MSVVGIVLAGGAGSRLAPLSTPEKPKQFLPLVGGVPGCVAAMHLLLRSGADELGIITSGKALSECESTLQTQTHEIISRTTVLVESHPAGTYFSYIVAAYQALADSILIVTPSDHWIANVDAMIAALRRAVALADNFGGIVVIGEAVNWADPAVGYLRVTQPTSAAEAPRLLAFVQRPGVERARQLAASGDHILWNTGITVARASVWRNLMDPLKPPYANVLKTAIRVGGYQHFDTKRLSVEVVPVGIDEAIISQPWVPVRVQRVRSGWHDIGTPEGLARARAATVAA